jgi:hypothetical protein
MNVASLRLFHAPEDRFRLTVDDEKSFLVVKPVWSSPLSHPGQFLSLLDGKGEEIVMLADPKELPTESHRSLELELKRRYLTSTILSIDHAKVEFGATYWTVQTDRGSREFVTQSLQENAQWLGENHLLLVDVDGNRFEITDVSALDEASRHYIETIL